MAKKGIRGTTLSELKEEVRIRKIIHIGYLRTFDKHVAEEFERISMRPEDLHKEYVRGQVDGIKQILDLLTGENDFFWTRVEGNSTYKELLEREMKGEILDEM